MPILERAKPVCFFESVGVWVPEKYDIWASFGDPFLIIDTRPELTPKGEGLLEINRSDRSALGKRQAKKIMQEYEKSNGDTICTIQPLSKGIEFDECQMLTLAQVKAMIDPRATRRQLAYNKHKRKKGDFAISLLWWRD